MSYKLFGTDNIPKEKAATFGYKPFETEDINEFIEYINTHAIINGAVKGGHRDGANMGEIFNIIRLDVDAPGEFEKVDAALKDKGLEHFKKPSTRNDGKEMAWKFHYIIPVIGAAQSKDEYKQQHKWVMDYLGIKLEDNSVRTPMQNMNPRGRDGIARTTHTKGKIVTLPHLKVPTLHCQQLIMSPLFYNSALLQHDNSIHP